MSEVVVPPGTGLYVSQNVLQRRRKEEDGKVQPSQLDLTVQVLDAEVRRAAGAADDFERVVVRVPYDIKGQREPGWKDYPLEYAGRSVQGYYDRDVVDNHTAHLSNVNTALVARHGVAVRAEYGNPENPSVVVWGQPKDENHKPVVR